MNLALPLILGVVQEGKTLSASTGSWSGSPTSFAYQWRSCDAGGSSCADIAGATGSTFVVRAADVGHTIRVAVTATNAGGSASASSVQSTVVIPAPPANTALPSISGAAQQGQTLTAANGSWSGAPTSFAYQWRSCDTAGAACVDAGGATSSTYVVQAADVGHTFRVTVTATNAGGSTAAVSPQTAVVVGALPVNTALPTISGTARQGQTLTAANGTWTGNPTSFAYQWRSCDAAGAACVNAAGATSSAYVLQAADVGHTFRVVVTATNAAGSVSATSAQTGTVLGLPPANTALPVVSGTARQGSLLSASNGTWSGSPTSFAYQWRDCGTGGAGCVDVAGATGSSYVLQASDVGSTVRVVVTATNANGSTSATSAQTGVVAAAAWTVSSSILAGQILTGKPAWTATVAGISTGQVGSVDYYVDGVLGWTEHLSPYVFNGDGNTLDTTALSNGSHTFTVVATATDGTTSTAQAVASVSNGVAGPPVNSVLPSVSGTAQQGQTLSASTGTWSGSPTSFAYRWRDCDASGAGCVDIAGATGSSYLLQAADVGHTLRVVVTATNGSGSTPATSAQTGVVAAATSGAPVNSVLPSVSGTAQQGQTLSASTGTWSGSPTSFAYRWRDCDASGAGCVDIAGATGSSYLLQAADVGHTLRVVVTATNGSGSTPATSAQTGVVASTAGWSVSSSILAGQTLTGKLAWTASLTGISTGQIDSVDYYIDGVLRWTEHLSPYVFNGDGNTLDTTTLSTGSHTFVVIATATNGVTASSGPVAATVSR